MKWLKVAHHQSTLIARRYERARLWDDLLTIHMAVVGREAATSHLSGNLEHKAF
jgi:hypothetical protein